MTASNFGLQEHKALFLHYNKVIELPTGQCIVSSVGFELQKAAVLSKVATEIATEATEYKLF